MQFKPDPYVVTALNCAVWVFYGMPFVHPDSLLVVTINGIGLFIEFSYIIVFFIYSDGPKRKKISIFLGVEIILFAILVFVTLTFLHGTKNRSMLVGILAVIMNVAMYASPLTVMIPNGLGTLSGAIQLILYAKYYKTTNWDDEGKPNEIELQRNADTV
uniref:Seven-transmembrane-domain protein 1 n=1 Tax=Solanum tuberosum TaxID=4113 RepID=M1C9T3_SOLTU